MDDRQPLRGDLGRDVEVQVITHADLLAYLWVDRLGRNRDMAGED